MAILSHIYALFGVLITGQISGMPLPPPKKKRKERHWGIHHLELESCRGFFSLEACTSEGRLSLLRILPTA